MKSYKECLAYAKSHAVGVDIVPLAETIYETILFRAYARRTTRPDDVWEAYYENYF